MKEAAAPRANRLIAYIDGFNLYHGLKNMGWERYLWLNVWELVLNIRPNESELGCVKYFTSRIAGPASKRERQNAYIDALSQLEGFEIHYGQFLYEDYLCPHCSRWDKVPTEKRTDVNIAVEMITDAYQDQYDVALLVSGDSDLVGPVQAVRRFFPNKRVIVAFPPKRHNASLEPPVSSASFVIGRAKFAQSQFTDEIVRADGYVLKRPGKWK
jgi:uncharacterized LabA/DUF88 family protein